MSDHTPAGTQRYLEDISVGDSIVRLDKTPDAVQLFLFSAATWNPHRIHYDAGYAATEGYDGILVQSHLHGSFLAQAALDWAGSRARLLGLSWQNRRLALAGEPLSISGTVTAIDDDIVTIALSEVNGSGDECVPGTVRIRLPRRGDRS